MKDWARSQPHVAQIVVHNTTSTSLRLTDDMPLPSYAAGARLAQVARGVAVDLGGTLCRATVPRRVSQSGLDLDDDAQAIVTQVQDAFGSENTA